MKLTGQGLANFVTDKIGTPYVYGAKGADGKFTKKRLDTLAAAYPNMFTYSYIKKATQHIGKVCTDCSGLISWYTKKNIGSYQMRQVAVERIPISELNRIPVGAVLWKDGHVGVYVGNEMHVEARGINYGTVMKSIDTQNWKEALLFKELDYNMPINNVKIKNPYKVPTVTLTKGSKGESVAWVQYELREAGLKYVLVNGIYQELKIDGSFGAITDKAVRLYQQSCKLEVDGKVGKQTRTALLTT